MAQTTHLPAPSQQPARGFTLTEIAIVLGIIGFILGSIWAAAGMVYENNRTKSGSMQMVSIINNWKAIFGNKHVDIANGNDMTQLSVNNAFTSNDMIPPAGTTGGCVAGGSAASCYVLGPWSGSRVNVISYQNDNGVAIQFTNLSQSACNHLGNATINDSGLISIVINGGTVYKFAPLGTDAILTSSQVSSMCNATTVTNSILAEFSMN